MRDAGGATTYKTDRLLQCEVWHKHSRGHSVGLNDVPDKGYRASESKGEASATGAGGINQAMTPHRVPMCDEGSMCDAGR